MAVEAVPAAAAALDPHRTSHWCLQVAAGAAEGRGGGVHVEEVLHHARSELSPQQDPAGGIFPENREYLESCSQELFLSFFPSRSCVGSSYPGLRQARQNYSDCPSVCLPGKALVW